MGQLPWFLGENDAQRVMDKLRLGNFSVPVMVTDSWGNEVSRTMNLTIVDTMQPLKKGWNLVSFPVKLDSAFATWEAIYNLGNGLKASDALSYNATAKQWVGITPDYRIKPLEAIYIYATGDDQISSIFARNPTSPPMRNLDTGWNLVGLAIPPTDWDTMPVNEAMVSVETASPDRGYSIVVSPAQWFDYGENYNYKDVEGRDYGFGGYGWSFHQEPWVYTVASSYYYSEAAVSEMMVGGGYWVFMEHPDTLAGFSTTPVTMVVKPPVPEVGHDLPLVPRYNWEPTTRKVFEEYQIEGYNKIYVKYFGEVSPSQVFRFYQEQMPGFGWELSEYNAGQDSANLWFSMYEGYATLYCNIEVQRYESYNYEMGGYIPAGIYITYERYEPGVDLSDVPRFDWQPTVMISHYQWTDESGTSYTDIRYRYWGDINLGDVFKFYQNRMGQYPYYWKFVDGGCDYGWANLTFQRTDKEGKTYMCFIGAQNGVIEIEHHKFTGAAPAALYGLAYIDKNPVASGTPVSAWIAGRGWSQMPSGTTVVLADVWGSSGSDVFAVGDGIILHYNGSIWSQMSSNPTVYVNDVWGSSGSDVFAVGDNGTIVHYNGSNWSPMSSNTTVFLEDVWGSSGSDVFAVGTEGIILHYNGSIWSPMVSTTTNPLHAVWGSSGKDVFAVGPGGIIIHFNGSTWSLMSSNTTRPLYAVWGSSGSDVFAVGTEGIILHYNGSIWSPMVSTTTNPLHAVWGSSGKDVFAVGPGGIIIHFNGSTWSLMSSPTTNILFGVWGSSGRDVFVVGNWGTILHNQVQVAQTYTGSYITRLPQYYRLMVPPDNPLTPDIKEGGVQGDIVTFKIGSLTADETREWNSGNVMWVSLNAWTPGD